MGVARRRTGSVLVATAALVANLLSVGPAGALGEELATQRREARAADAVAEAFDAVGLADDPAGTVPLAIVTETRGGRRLSVVRVDAATDAATHVAAAMRSASVVSVGVDQRASAEAVVDVSDQWQLDADQTSFAAAWGTVTDAGVTVAVLDTGVQGEHEDLSPRVLQGVEMLAGDGSVTASNGWNDLHGHGTHVAGIIAASRGNGLGVAGMAPDVSILPVRVLDSNATGWMSDIAAGVYWAVAQGASVINLSLGSMYSFSPLEDALDYAVANGVVVVAAAGNSGPESVRYPAAYAAAIAVAAGAPYGRGAVDSYSSYSTTSPYVDLTAPGSWITSTLSTRSGTTAKYGAKSGTSMAAPHVAGAAALLRAAAPGATAAQIRAALESTAIDVEAVGPDPKSGAGLVDPVVALATLVPPTTTSTTTTTLASQSATTSTTSTTTMTPPTTTVPEPPLPAGASRFVATTPVRVLDTRGGAPVPAGGLLDVALGGAPGIDPAATAVVLNVTVTGALGPGFVQVFPTGRSAVGASSNLNVAEAGQTIANQVTLPLGTGGTVSVFVQGGGHVLLDVFGTYVPSAATAPGRYRALSPARVLDTRTGFGVSSAVDSTSGVAVGDTFRSRSGGSTTFAVTGVAGVPVSGVAAVALNITAVDAEPGFVQAVPTGGASFGAYSNLNVSSRPVVANLAVVPVGAGGTVTIYTESGAHLVVDLLGYVTSATAPVSTSGLFVPVTPARVADTRSATKPGRQTSLTVRVAGAGGVPSSGAAAVLANVTAVDASAPGFLQVFPTGEAVPGSSSNVNLTAVGQTVPNSVAATLARGGPGSGSATVYVDAGAHVLFDVAGWFTA
jgi:serine protease